MDAKKLGKYGEDIACQYLKSKGCRILSRNYSKKWSTGPEMGEIDIIAKKKDIISFIEVKTSEPSVSGNFFPEDRVDFKKRKQIAKLAQIWLGQNKIPLDSKWQIDVVSVGVDVVSKKAKIRHFENIDI